MSGLFQERKDLKLYETSFRILQILSFQKNLVKACFLDFKKKKNYKEKFFVWIFFSFEKIPSLEKIFCLLKYFNKKVFLLVFRYQ